MEDLAHNPGMYPDWELNQQPFGLQVNHTSQGLMNFRKEARQKTWAWPDSQLVLTLCHGAGGLCGCICLPKPTEDLGPV